MLTIDTCAHSGRLRRRCGKEKLLLACGPLLMTLLLPPLPGAPIIAIGMAGAALLWARVPVRVYCTALAVPLGFLATGALPLCVTLTLSGGQPHLAWTAAGAVAALGVVLRSLAAVTCLLLLALTTPMPQLLLTLRRLRVSAEVVDLAMLVYRFLFASLEIAEAVRIAQMSRLGYETPSKSFRSLAVAAGALFGRVFAQSRRMENGLMSRGWEGDMRVLNAERPAPSSRLAVIALCQGALFILLFAAGRRFTWPI